MNLDNALFYDIETHRGKDWSELSPAMQKAFIGHYYDPQTYASPEEHYCEIAGLHAEFSQVICVVFGYVNRATGQFQTTAIYGEDEIKVLEGCRKVFDTFYSAGYYLIGHNINGCDTPYMVKRYIINKMMVPKAINEWGLKPWDKNNTDSMDIWKFGDWKRVSLEMICAALGISCKTDEIGGDNLYTYDLKDMPWDQLVHYCTEDVVSNYEMMKHILTYYDTE